MDEGTHILILVASSFFIGTVFGLIYGFVMYKDMITSLEKELDSKTKELNKYVDDGCETY